MELQPQEQCEISSTFAGPVYLLVGFCMCSTYSDCSKSYFEAAESPDVVCDAQDRPVAHDSDELQYCLFDVALTLYEINA